MKPLNILLLLTDQQRYDSLGINGNSRVKTPNLDRLGREGVAFSQATTPCPLCTPARASIYTGQYLHSHKAVWNVSQQPIGKNCVATGRRLLTELMADAGYHVSTIGKWHLGPDDPRRGEHIITADNNDAEEKENHDYSRYLKSHDLPPWSHELAKSREPGTRHAGVSAYPREHYFSNYIADRAVEFLQDHARRPFFLCVSDFYPHRPWMPPEPFDRMYDPAEMELSPNITDSLEGKPRVQRESANHRLCRELTLDQHKRHRALYMGVVSVIDEACGRVLQALRDLSLEEDTLVIFTTDHGEMLGNHQISTKGPYMYEELVHIPFLMRCPWINTPGERNELISLVDVAPTILDACGVPVPEWMEGRSILSLLTNSGPAWRQAAFSQYWYKIGGALNPGVISMVRTKGWKYCQHLTDRHELYDLENDPHEMSNLIDEARCARELSELQLTLAEWMRGKIT